MDKPNRQKSISGRTQLFFGLLVFLYLLFIGFASFYDTNGFASSRSLTDLLFRDGAPRIRFYNLRDISTNILLYMPLGFLVALTIATRRSPRLLSAHLLWGLLISITVEISQAYIGRFSDFTDMISNGCGYAIGYVIAQQWITRFSVNPSVLLGMGSADNNMLDTLCGIRFVYVVISFITSLLPLNLTVSLTDIYAKLGSTEGNMPRLILDPLYHWYSASADIQYLVLKGLVFLPLAFLSTLIQKQRSRPAIMAPAFHCLLLGMAIELSNLFILSGRSDIVVPLLGFAIGLLVAGTLVKLTQTADPQRTSGIYDNRLYLYVNALVLYGFLLLLISLSPFDFEISLASIRNKFLNDSNFIPFMAHFSSRSISSAIDIVREFILYAPLGALLVLTLRSLVRSISTPVQLLLCGVFTGSIAMVLELLQLMVQGRYVDVTDCLLAVGGGIAGAILAPLFSEPIENKIAVKPQSQ